MCTLVRYVSPTNGSIRTELLELIPLNATDCSAVKIYEAFKLCLNQKDIPLNNITGLACDGANVMVVNHNSFYSHLKTDVPSVILMKCICHSAALIASKACEQLPRSTEELLRGVESYVSGSAKRCAQLCEIQDYFNKERKIILKLANTRWLSMYQCVSRVLETWDILLHYFQLAVFEDKLKSAEFILGELQNSYTKAYLLFLKYVLNCFNSFNALFQSRSILLHKLSTASVQLLKEFCSHFLKVDILNQIHLSKIDVKNPF
ncbi:uncharacterized protein LOC103308486 [Acyrthosiphon pisum]|uniref:Uncharacterized protein n=1 Tax=Acyrthosiphon pisum TaxID=7029 RepID=A0A8R1WZ77_ACYPI|nr:uncharacterized protein LOC103308486 [Acyrthosiphon pisum]|eukprot:XP_008180143.1 PREDICTED: uncharacterized protein LOC103308486 [Acyrthosiphon pisum]